jgi:hypothetical protein
MNRIFPPAWKPVIQQVWKPALHAMRPAGWRQRPARPLILWLI